MIILLSITTGIAIVAILVAISCYHGMIGVLHYLKINGIAASQEELKEQTNWAVENSINRIINIFRRK